MVIALLVLVYLTFVGGLIYYRHRTEQKKVEEKVIDAPVQPSGSAPPETTQIRELNNGISITIDPVALKQGMYIDKDEDGNIFIKCNGSTILYDDDYQEVIKNEEEVETEIKQSISDISESMKEWE